MPTKSAHKPEAASPKMAAAAQLFNGGKTWRVPHGTCDELLGRHATELYVVHHYGQASSGGDNGCYGCAG